MSIRNALIAAAVAGLPTVAMAEPASSGWVEFKAPINAPLVVPVRLNGQPRMAMLYGGPSMLDEGFAASAGLRGGDQPARIQALTVEVGRLALQNAVAAVGPIASPFDDRLAGGPLTYGLGEEVFRQFAVDIDFAHHRLALRDPRTLRRPTGAIEIPLVQKGDAKETQWVVPLSVDGAAPAWFEVELGNVSGPLLVTRGFAETHGLLQGHPTSQRRSGPFHETVVSLDHLTFAGVDFPGAPIAIIPDSENPPEPVTGGVGLPLLSRFHIIFDYPHHRLFAIPIRATRTTPIPKDRLGLYLNFRETGVAPEQGLAVAFVAPGSPAAEAGLKTTDRVVQIDDKPSRDWPARSLVALNMAASGTRRALTLADGRVVSMTARDFF
jgi:PDZ domain